MTVTSMSRLPAVEAPAAAPSGVSPDALIAGGFGALVAAHLATLTDTAEPDTAGTAATAVSVDAEPATDSDGLAAVDGSSPGETAADAEAMALVPITPIHAPVPVPVPVPVPAGAGVGEPGGKVEVSAVGSAASRVASDQGPATHRPAVLTQVRAAGTTGESSPATIVADSASADETVAGAPTPTAAPMAEPTTTARSSYAAVDPVTAETTPLGGPGPATSAGSPMPTGQTAAAAVTSQVFPTVPALVSRGEGTHSITLRLHPADLGEVHVTVSVRDGAVQVTLAAGREAQEALRAGSGELRSLLDLAGASGGQLVVRDLPSSPAPVPAGTTSGSFQLPAGQASTDGGPGGHDKDTPVSERARADASADDVAVSDTTLRPQARAAAGLDLTL